jgi:ketosteroid isomerase-like protein
MKTLVLLALAGLAIGFPAPTLAQEQKAVDPEVRQQIEALSLKFVEARNKHDAAAMVALYTQDAVEVQSWATSWGGGTFSGRQAIEKMFGVGFALNHGQMADEIVQVYAIGNDICAIADRSVGEWKAHAVTIYVRAHDSWEVPWKIRMVYVNSF